jgi:uncharacterized protein YegP (UPF0339 family)
LTSRRAGPSTEAWRRTPPTFHHWQEREGDSAATPTKREVVMAAKFEILQPKPGEFRWVLTSQGRVLARSDSYTRKASCVNAMESFRKAAPTAVVDDRTVAPAKGGATRGDKPATAKAARTAGRVLGKAAAKAKELVGNVEEAVAPAPRKRAPRAAKTR